MSSGVKFHDSPAAQVYRIQHFFQIAQGKPFGFRTFWLMPVGTNPTVAAMTSLAQDAYNAWNSNLKGQSHSAISLVNTVATDLTTRASSQGVFGSTLPGTAAGTANSPAAAVLVNHKTAQRYRGGHGRSYLPCGTASSLQDSLHWTTAFVTTMTTAWNSYLAAISTNGHVPTSFQVVVSYFKGAQPNSAGNVWGPANVPLPRVDAAGNPTPQAWQVTNSVVSVKVGQQQRRAGYR